MSQYLRTGKVHTRYMQPLDLPDERPDCAVQAWQSRDYLAVLYDTDAGRRLTVNRTDYSVRRGDWRDGIGWDDLQRIKTQCLGEDVWAVEIYPPPKLVDVDPPRFVKLRHDSPAFVIKCLYPDRTLDLCLIRDS